LKSTKPYTIAINTRALIKDKLDGIGWYTYHVLKHWVESHPEHQFYFIFDRPYDDQFIFEKNVTPIIVNPPARHPILWYIWYEFSITSALKKINPDIFISLDSYTSTSWKGKKIIGIHDIAFALFDDHIGKLVQYFMRYFTPKYIACADKIITVSNATKKDLISFYNCPEDKIVLSHNAPSSAYKPLSTDEIIDFKSKYTDNCDFFLFVGSIHPRKNVLKLLQGFETYKTTHSSLHKLVIIGRLSWQYDDIVSFHYKMKYKNDVIFISHSSPELISKYMGSSTALCMVSVYEGFGVPIVEAMASGVPIICSNISSMPEVAGDAAILVSSENEREIAEAMQTISTDIELRNRLVKNGKEQVKKYNWASAAEIVWAEIEKLIGK
jgi:glycosyltransferase involved in cell wall biosynthesis